MRTVPLKLVFNTDDCDLFDRLDIASMLHYTLSNYRELVVAWLQVNEMCDEVIADVDEWWGLGSLFIYEYGFVTELKLDYNKVYLTIS